MAEIEFKAPVAVPHKYRNRFLRDVGASSSTSGSSSVGSSVDLSPYLKKTEAESTYLSISNAESTYLKIATFDDLFEKELQDDGTYVIKAKYSLYSVGSLTAYGYGEDEEKGSIVSWSQIITTGTCIAQITIDGVTTNVYAPNGGGGGTVNSWTDIADRPSWLDSYVGSNVPSVSLFSNDAGYLTSSALSGYATESWVEDKGYITSSALSGYATESWVEDKGYITSSALSGYATESWVEGKEYLTDSVLNSKTITLWGNEVSLNNGSTYGTILTKNANSEQTEVNQGAIKLYHNTPFIDFYKTSDDSFNLRMINSADGVLELYAQNPRLKIGNAYLSYDSDNNCLYLDNGSGDAVNFCAQGEVVAMGAGSSESVSFTNLDVSGILTAARIDDTPLLYDGLYIGVKASNREITDFYYSNGKLYVEFGGGSATYELTPTNID